MNVVGLWTFGRQVRSKVNVHLFLREVGTKLGDCFFVSFFLCVLTSVEGSALVCFTIQFMATTCFQAILQTAIAEGQRYCLHARSKFGNILMIKCDRYHLGYHVTCQSVCCAVALTLSRPIVVEQNGRENFNNVCKSGLVAVKNVGRVFSKQLHFYPKIRKTK